MSDDTQPITAAPSNVWAGNPIDPVKSGEPHLGACPDPEPHPEGNPALVAACQAILNRRLATSHGIGDDTARRAALLIEILPDAATALEAAEPYIRTDQREQDAQLAEQHGAQYLIDHGDHADFRAFADLLREAQP